MTFPAEDEPDGEVQAPHHYYIGLFMLFFGFTSIWPFYPATGATTAIVGFLIVGDDLLSHAFGVPTPLDLLWKKVLVPIINTVE
jgi:hypothetical protein